MVNDTITQVSGQIFESLPKLTGIGSKLVSIVAISIIVAIVVIITTIFLLLYYHKKRYKFTIVLFEKINDNWVDTGLDKGREILFGDLGRILWLKKYKIYIPFPRYLIANRRAYYKKRSDGSLENWRIRDDEDPETIKKLDMSKSMILQHTAINRGLEKRYDKVSLLSQYAPIIISVVFIIMFGVMAWLLLDRFIEISKSINSGIDSVERVQETQNSILGKLDNLMSKEGLGGSGIIPFNQT